MDDPPPPIDDLVSAARDVSRLAYCPYSDFPVGAALLAEDGRIFVGCNVENVSYGLALCAERSAVAQMVAAGAKTIRALVVYTPTETPTPPCGACRQVLAEFGSDARIVSVCQGSQQIDTTLNQLLPKAFSKI